MEKRKESKKKKKVPWWVTVIIVILCIIVGFLAFSYGMIRFFVGDSLGFKGTLAMVGYGGMELPDGVTKFILDVNRDYEGLPDIFTFNDGSNVDDKEEYEQRREEMLDLYSKYGFGYVPKTGFETTFELVESGEALNGAAIRDQVKVTVTSEKGSSESMMLIYRPADKTDCPVFVGLNFNGNTTVWNDSSIIPSFTQSENPSYGTDSSWPVEQIISSGCAVVTLAYGDFAADSSETYRDRVLSVLSEETTAMSAWAFGISRAVDYIEQSEWANTDAIASVGHSRLARVSLWAGANDDRIDLVTASCGGGIQRSEILGRIINNPQSSHWNTAEYLSYENRDNELPIDRHMLLALCADEDRHLFISAGASDLAADPVGMYDAFALAKKVWSDIYGVQVVADGTYYDHLHQEPAMSEGVAFFVHDGAHALTAEDWSHYITYMLEYVK